MACYKNKILCPFRFEQPAACHYLFSESNGWDFLRMGWHLLWQSRTDGGHLELSLQQHPRIQPAF